jgi:hypothetical protein
VVSDAGQYVPNPATYLNGARWEDERGTTPHMSDRTINAVRDIQEFVSEKKP